MKRTVGFIALLILIPGEGVAEYWSCQRQGVTSEVYTNTPTSSAESVCSPLSLAHSPYNKVPRDAFGRVVEKSEFVKGANVENERARLGEELETTMKFREISAPQKRDFQLCEVSGEARGKEAKEAHIIVTRGAVTQDSLRIILRNKFRPVPWKMTLQGKCRQPEVQIK